MQMLGGASNNQSGANNQRGNGANGMQQGSGNNGSNGNVPPPQQGMSQQHQYNEPPMDFDSDIPFAPVGLMYNNALIHCI